MRMSYSRAGAFDKCPYQFKLRYIDKLEAERDTGADDPLIVGTAMHHAIEEGVEKAVAEYHRSFPISTDAHVAEEIKIRALAPKVRAIIPEGGVFETELEAGESFVGFVDYAAKNPTTGKWTLYDFKYTAPKNAQRYASSAQLQVYAWYWEKLGLGEVEALAYVIVPKTSIRQKKTETVVQFRKRLAETLSTMEPELVWVPNDARKVVEYFETVVAVESATEYPKNPTRLCDWCDYKTFCKSEGKDKSMILPKNERRDISKAETVKIWIYGEPFSGKTTFANKFPHPLMLNTDGNVKYVDAPYIALKDETKTEGRLVKKVFGWQTLKDAIEELEKDPQGFETVVLDLAEGAYEMNRSYVYDKYGWEHESDDSFRAWDIVRKEYFDTLRRLTNLPMNVVLISHEDTTRDFTKRGGDKVSSVKPNIQDKVAKVLAGMVDIVGRAVVRDGEHYLAFKTDEFVFGGGRLKIEADEIPLDFAEFCDLIGFDAGQGKAEEPEEVEEVEEAEEPEEEAPKPAKRTRSRRVSKPEPEEEPEEEKAPWDVEEEEPAEEPEEKPVKRVRKRRVRSEE